jgi:hypothetical protein
MSFDEAQLNRLLEALQFGASYPSPGTTSGTAQGGGPVATSDLQQRVTAAIQGVLGRSFKQGDYRSFRVALEASFEYKEEAGRSAYEWKPRAYPLTGGSDLGGGVTGAQYSLFSLANVLYEQTLPIIDNLSPLIPDVDKEQLEAARAIFRSTWSEFITELGREGGPRAQRADLLSVRLYREDTRSISNTNVTIVEGHLVRFGRLLGMLRSEVDATKVSNATNRRAVNEEIARENDIAPVTNGRPDIARFNVLTTDEEENLTNFIALTDIYLTIAQRWESYSETFLRQGVVERDLGTGLLSLERLFAVLEESVSEVYVAMDSVNVDQAERLVLPADPDNPTGIKIEDLLSWISTFASTEAPQLVREGGKWGVEAILDTTATLMTLTDTFVRWLRDSEAEPPPPSAFRHSRVINPVDEMVTYLSAIDAAAREILGQPPPVSLNPQRRPSPQRRP